MKTTIIDLLKDSPIYKDCVSSQKHLDCKFVLITSPEEIVLIFGPLEKYSYHANLVEYYCKQQNIPSAWEHRPDVYVIYSSLYAINGGGWFRFDFMTEKLLVRGISTAYGRFNQPKLEQALKSAEFVNSFEIIISE